MPALIYKVVKRNGPGCASQNRSTKFTEAGAALAGGVIFRHVEKLLQLPLGRPLSERLSRPWAHILIGRTFVQLSRPVP
jgi:hypothetical protein